MSLPRSKILRLVQFNVENLFLFLDFYEGQNIDSMTEDAWRRLSSSTTPNKSLRKCRLLRDVILQMDPDILCLNEVGGLESLENFNKYFLDSKYNCLLKEGNSNRGIDIGYLIKKEHTSTTLLISHKNRALNFLYPHERQTISGGKSHYFSRDVAELRLFKPGVTSPYLIILLVHLKSKLDPEGIDSGGRKRRAAELKTLVQIYKEVRSELSNQVPVVVLGDMNGVARKNQPEPEFEELHTSTDLIDALADLQLPEEKRLSQVQIMASGKSQNIQIDYIFMSPDLKSKVIAEGSGTFMYHTELGQPAPLPRSLDERGLLPSDHYPLVLNLLNDF